MIIDLDLFSFQDDDEHLFTNDGEDDDRLFEYMNEISLLSADERSDRLRKDCQQILSKHNVPAMHYADLDLNQIALITMHSLYHQHVSDEAKQMYNDTLIRALKQEYELINNEKTDCLEQYHRLEEEYQRQTATNTKTFGQLQHTYDELLEQNELERLHAKQSTDSLMETFDKSAQQMQINVFTLHEENQKLKYNYEQLKDQYERSTEKNYDELDEEYQRLRQDYNDVINQNELLKDINSKMYQETLQDTNGKGKSCDRVCSSFFRVYCQSFEHYQ
jgi:hypothetical protein